MEGFQEYSTERRSERKQYPEKLALELGKPATLYYMDAPRRYEGQDIIEARHKEAGGKVVTWWVPAGLACPPVHTPFQVVKTAEGVKGKSRSQYKLLVPVTDEAKRKLWSPEELAKIQ